METAFAGRRELNSETTSAIGAKTITSASTASVEVNPCRSPQRFGYEYC